MTLTAATRPESLGAAPLSRGERREQRRRLHEQDLRAARLADLHRIGEIAAGARALVETGWLQRAWFAYVDADDRRHVVTAHNAHLLGGHPVTEVCLAGAVVHAGGGLAAVQSQPVQRALDLTWHVLARGGDDDVRWCPGPQVRARHLRELTAWNDHPTRTRREVGELLHAVGDTAARLARR